MVTGSAEQRILIVYRDTIDALYAYAARHSGGDRTLAEDVTQETWLRAVREWRRSGPPEKPLAWLIAVAHNLLASYYRRRRPQQLDADTAAELRAIENGGAAGIDLMAICALLELGAGHRLEVPRRGALHAPATERRKEIHAQQVCVIALVDVDREVGPHDRPNVQTVGISKDRRCRTVARACPRWSRRRRRGSRTR